MNRQIDLSLWHYQSCWLNLLSSLPVDLLNWLFFPTTHPLVRNPGYSPDFNLIELVWHSCKEYIAHRLFQSVCELKFTLNKLLNNGELIIKWGRKVKNKGNAVCAN